MPTKKSTKAEAYRKRAADIGNSLKKRSGKGPREVLRKKKKALNDMADNEDWLDGKPGSQLKPKK